MRRLSLLLVFLALVGAVAGCGDDDGVRAEGVPGSTSTTAPESNIAGPALGDHWHIAVGFSKCGVELPVLSDARTDTTGIHSHGDGLIPVHPFTTAVTGDKAVLGAFFDTVGATVTDEGLETKSWQLPFKGECNGSPATMRVKRWPTSSGVGDSTSIASPSHLRSLPLSPDGAMLAIGLVAEHGDVPTPTSAAQLAAPSDLAAPAPSASGKGTPANVAFGFAAVLGMANPPCGNTATRSRDASKCYELAPVALGTEVVASATAEYDNVEWTVHLVLTDAGIDNFNNLAASCFNSTPKCPTQMLAIVVDQMVVSAPTLQSPSFEKDRIQISGGFTEQEARAIAESLQS